MPVTNRSPSGPAEWPRISGSSSAVAIVVRIPIPEIGLDDEPSSPAR